MWFKERDTCPLCRKQARKAVPGHTIQAIVEFYTQQNPEEKRSLAERRPLDRAYKQGDEASILRPGNFSEDSQN